MDAQTPRRGLTATRDRNRSLERGIEVLRTFRPGTDLLGNVDIAERTGLTRPTGTRQCQTLVDAGFLERDPSARAYRLAAPVLSLAHAMRSGSPLLAVAGPLMQAEAEKRKINIGLAVADGDEMVYLESVRYSRRVQWRNVVAGQRVPMELTSLGRAWLAAATPGQRAALMTRFRDRRGPRGWRQLEREIAQAMADVARQGYCWASWQPEVVALATPLRHGVLQSVCVLNMSVNSSESSAQVVERLSGPLLDLARQLEGLLKPV